MNSDNNKTTPFFKFENLRLYHKAIDFSNAILALATINASMASAHFFNRFFDETLNLVTTIANGSAESKNGFINHLQLTKVSIRNCVVLCTLASKRNLIDVEQENDIRNELMELTKMVGALLISLQRQDSLQEENMEDVNLK